MSRQGRYPEERDASDGKNRSRAAWVPVAFEELGIMPRGKKESGGVSRGVVEDRAVACSHSQGTGDHQRF